MKRIIFFIFFMLQTIIFSENLDNQLAIKQLNNGINYYTLENNYPNNRGIFKILTNIGTLNEEKRGSLKILEASILNDTKIKKITANPETDVYFDIDVNNTTITIEFNNLNSGIEIVKNILSLNIDNFENAKNIVIKNLNSDVNQFIYSNNLTNIIVGNNNIDDLSLPTFDTIKNISQKDFQDFSTSIFNPKNINFIAVGNFDKKIVAKFLEENFSSSTSSNNIDLPKMNIFSIPNGEKKFVSYSKEDNQTPNIINLIQILNIDEKSKIKEELKLDFMLGIINNRLYDEKNILNGSSYIFAKNKKQIVLTTIFFTDKKVSQYFTPIFLKKIKELAIIGISEEEFLKEKEIFEKRYTNMFNNLENHSNNSYAEAIVDGIKYEQPIYFDGTYQLELIKNLDYNEINSFIKNIFSQNSIEYYFLRK